MDSIAEERLKTMHAVVAEDVGRAVRVFKNTAGSSSSASSSSSNAEEPDDFYDLTLDTASHRRTRKDPRIKF